MKKVFTIVFITIFSIIIVGCGSKNIENEDKKSDNNSVSKMSTKIKSFEDALTKKKIKFNKAEKFAELAGAKEGYAYTFEDETYIEIYDFDPNSEAYKKVESTGNVFIDYLDFTLPVKANKGLAIYYGPDLKNKNVIEEIFLNIK